MSKCCICGAEVGADADILTMGGYGNERLLCSRCASLAGTAVSTRDFSEIAAAADELAFRVERFGCDDELALEALGELFAEAKERAEKIRLGTYDFSEEDAEAMRAEAESVEASLPEEEPQLTEEERAALAKKEKIAKILDVLTYVIGGAAIAGIIIFFILRFF